jgi:hypothetical protein
LTQAPHAEESRRSNARNKRDRQKTAPESNKAARESEQPSAVVVTAPIVSRVNGGTTVSESTPVIVGNDLKNADQAPMSSMQSSSAKAPKLKSTTGEDGDGSFLYYL